MEYSSIKNLTCCCCGTTFGIKSEDFKDLQIDEDKKKIHKEEMIKYRDQRREFNELKEKAKDLARLNGPLCYLDDTNVFSVKNEAWYKLWHQGNVIEAPPGFISSTGLPQAIKKDKRYLLFKMPPKDYTAFMYFECPLCHERIYVRSLCDCA